MEQDHRFLPVSSPVGVDHRWQSSNGSSRPVQLPLHPPPPPDFSPTGPFSEIPISPATAPSSLTESDHYAVAAPFVKFTSRTILNDKKLVNGASLSFGVLLSPGREIDPSPPAIQRDPERCHHCGGYQNLYSKLSAAIRQWQCILCNKSNKMSDCDLQSPELMFPVVDYMNANAWRPGLVPVLDVPVLLIIDESVDEQLLQHLQSSLHLFLDSLGSSTRIGIITYGKTVSIYDLSETSLAAADILPGDSAPSQELLNMLIYGTGMYLAPLHSCLPVAHAIISSLRPYMGDLRESARPRCLGTAVEVALLLINSVVKKGSHVIICAAGPNTHGAGSLPQFENHPNYAYLEANAVKHMERLGRKARQLETTVDLLCAGTCPVRVSTLEPLLRISGGVIVLHDDFGEAFGLNLQRSVTRTGGLSGVLEVRCSQGIGISSVIGPGREADQDSSDSDSFREPPAIALWMTSVEENQGFALTLQLTKDLGSARILYFQFVVRYVNIFQARITRVITVRLPVTSSVQKYLQAVDVEAAAVLIAKRTVLEAKGMSDAAELRLSLDQRMKDMCLKYGSMASRSRTMVFPKEIWRLPEVLFHLRRGPLLGGIIGHEDERMVIRNVFLQASYELSLRMVLPRLLMYHEGGAFEEVPAYNLAMQSETALVLDHGTDVHIWMGSELCQDEKRSAAAFAACKTLVHEVTDTRFPAPRMLTFKEGSSQARYLQARLIPAHDDPPYEQEARFPQLQSLTPEQRARLKVKFVITDEQSLSAWMKGLRISAIH